MRWPPVHVRHVSRHHVRFCNNAPKSPGGLSRTTASISRWFAWNSVGNPQGESDTTWRANFAPLFPLGLTSNTLSAICLSELERQHLWDLARRNGFSNNVLLVGRKTKIRRYLDTLIYTTRNIDISHPPFPLLTETESIESPIESKTSK